MEIEKLIDIILKVKKENEVVGTAFIVNNIYAITAYHVADKCRDTSIFLESYDGKKKFYIAEILCELFDKNAKVDIAILKLSEAYNQLETSIGMCKEKLDINTQYLTYGYPKINRYEKLFISGQLISPEGRLDIKNSTGDNRGVPLYEGMSGAPCISNDLIYGVIILESLTTSVTKPELFVCDFYRIVKYLNDNRELCSNQIMLKEFLENECKGSIVKEIGIDPHSKLYDDTFDSVTDKRNIEQKVTSICPDFSKSVLKSWQRKCTYARVELEDMDVEQRNAIIMATYIPCIEYIEEVLEENFPKDQSEVKNIIDVLKNEAVKYVKERTKDYVFATKNDKIIQNMVFNLIDTCFISFE